MKPLDRQLRVMGEQQEVEDIIRRQDRRKRKPSKERKPCGGLISSSCNAATHLSFRNTTHLLLT